MGEGNLKEWLDHSITKDDDGVLTTTLENHQMNQVFLGLVLLSFLFSAYAQINFIPSPGITEPMSQLGVAALDSAKSAVDLSLGLVGSMALFLGLLKIAENGGLLQIISRWIHPLMRRLFPEIPAGHPAMGAMIMNISANILGLGNAATPFGIRAMQELNHLNTTKDTASNSMVLFLAINTSSVTLIPTSVIALRSTLGSANPAAILPSTLFATACSTLVAIFFAKFLQERFGNQISNPTEKPQERTQSEGIKWLEWLPLVIFLSLIPLTVIYGEIVSPWMIPSLILFFIGFGYFKKVPVYESFVEGAKDGFQVAIGIIPYLVAILVAVGMFRASGAMNAVISPLSRITELIYLPAEVLPLAFLRSLSGSGSFGVLSSILSDTAIGPDSYIGNLASTIYGSSETTFYVIAVYFGAVQIKKIRHSVWAGLAGDLAGVLASIAICVYLFR